MTERRRWKAEEKLAVIEEIKETNRVVETCRKYSVDPGMYYRWKESYETFGLDGLKPRYRRRICYTRGDEFEMYGRETKSLKSYKTILSPIRGPNQWRMVI